MLLVTQSRVHDQSQDLDAGRGQHLFPFDTDRSSADCRLFLVKWMKAVLFPSKEAPLLLSHAVARSLDDSVETAHVLCSGRANHPRIVVIDKCDCTAFWLMRSWTRSALRKRNRMGDKGEPYGSPACSRSLAADACPFTTIVAVRSEQKRQSNSLDLKGCLSPPAAVATCLGWQQPVSLHRERYPLCNDRLQ